MSVEALAYQPKEAAGFKEKELFGRLNRWRDERPWLRRFWEWNARKRIVNTMQDDLNKPQTGFMPTKEIKNLTRILDNQLQGKNLLSVEKIDSITKEPFVTEVFKENTSWVAQERKPAGQIISQARIEANGNTFLTLNFQGPRHERFHANPGIFIDQRFPQATAKVFNFLAASVIK